MNVWLWAKLLSEEFWGSTFLRIPDLLVFPLHSMTHGLFAGDLGRATSCLWDSVRVLKACSFPVDPSIRRATEPRGQLPQLCSKPLHILLGQERTMRRVLRPLPLNWAPTRDITEDWHDHNKAFQTLPQSWKVWDFPNLPRLKPGCLRF